MRASGPNERLRHAMRDAGYSIEALAEATGYHPKQVGRWIAQSVVPRRAGATAAIAEVLGKTETDIWPTVTHPAGPNGHTTAEIVQIYPHRADVPQAVWRSLLERTEARLDILVYAGLFLPEQHPQLSTLLRKKASSGTRTRFLLGDPDCPQVLTRSREEGINDAIAAKIRNVMTFYEPLARRGDIDVKLHQTTLYNSIYRFDDDMLVNLHVYGAPAAHAPVMHLHRHDADRLFDTYASIFERIWGNGAPAWPKEPNGHVTELTYGA